jgi:hypothetical protein
MLLHLEDKILQRFGGHFYLDPKHESNRQINVLTCTKYIYMCVSRASCVRVFCALSQLHFLLLSLFCARFVYDAGLCLIYP